MRALVLSRKGFDSAAGGGPSPILPDGRLVPLPIPDPRSPIRYGDLGPVGELAVALGRVGPGDGAHLDPDLWPETISRAPGWQPLFGQEGAAAAHLANQGVGVGDAFCFFGLFREAEEAATGWRWVPGSRPRHIVWGWLRVAEVWPIPGPVPGWAAYHPHARDRGTRRNTLYTGPAGRANLVLTAPDARGPSEWLLPAWFAPGGGQRPLTYHGRADRWRRTADGVRVRAVGRGQEFVLHAADYPESEGWLSQVAASGQG